jgi:hypothetical protein
MFKIIKLYSSSIIFYRIKDDNHNYIIETHEYVKKLDTILFLSGVKINCLETHDYINLTRTIKNEYYTDVPDKFNTIIKELLKIKPLTEDPDLIII